MLDLPQCGPSALLATKKASFGKKACLQDELKVLSRVAGMCDAGWRADVSEVRRWVEAEVAAANAQVDTLGEILRKSQGDNLSADACTSEEAGVADVADSTQYSSVPAKF